MGFFNNITGSNIFSSSLSSSSLLCNNFTGNISYSNTYTGTNSYITNSFLTNINTNNITGNLGYFNNISGNNLIFSNMTINSITGNIAFFNNVFTMTGRTGPTGYLGPTGILGATGFSITGPTGYTGSNPLFIGMRAYNKTPQNNTPSANFVFSGWTTVFDTNNGFNTTNGSYTIPRTGKYLVQSQLCMSGNPAGAAQSQVQIRMRLTSPTTTLIQSGSYYMWNTSLVNTMPYTDLIYNFTQGDVIQTTLNAPGTRALVVTDNSYNIMEVTYLGPNAPTLAIQTTGPTGTYVNPVQTQVNMGNNNITGVNTLYTTTITGTNLYSNTNITGTNMITLNEINNGIINIYETITGSTILSTTQDTILNSMSGGFTGFLYDSTGYIGQIKNIRLLNRRCPTVTIQCQKGSFDLNAAESQKTLIYTSNGWQMYNPTTILTSNSFYPTTQQGNKLVGSGGSATPLQGVSQAMSADGNTMVVGGTTDAVGSIGAVWVFIRTGNTWTQQGNKLVGTNYTGTNIYQGQATSLSADGNTLAIGARGDNSQMGATWIFVRNSAGTWSQQGSKIVGTGSTGTTGNQGNSVSLSSDGNTLAVGGYGDNGGVGATWIFTRNSTGLWTQQGEKLIASGNTGNAQQGWCVSLSSDGNTLVSGGNLDNSSVGAAWTFTRNSTGLWSQYGNKIIGSGNTGNSQIGYSVSLSSNVTTLALGGPIDNSNNGATWIFTNTATGWVQSAKIVGVNNIGAAKQGFAVALSSDGNTLISGGNSDNTTVGAAWVFTRIGGCYTNLWKQKAKLIPTGYSGSPAIANCLAMNSDGSTMVLGGVTDNSNVGASWIFV